MYLFVLSRNSYQAGGSIWCFWYFRINLGLSISRSRDLDIKTESMAIVKAVLNLVIRFWEIPQVWPFQVWPKFLEIFSHDKNEYDQNMTFRAMTIQFKIQKSTKKKNVLRSTKKLLLPEGRVRRLRFEISRLYLRYPV